MGYIYWKPCFWWAHENLSTHWQEMRLWLCVAWGNNVCNSKWTILIVFLKTKICNWHGGCKHRSQNTFCLRKCAAAKTWGRYNHRLRLFKKICQGNTSMSWYTHITEQKRRSFIQPGLEICLHLNTEEANSLTVLKSNWGIFLFIHYAFLWTVESVNGRQSLFVV